MGLFKSKDKKEEIPSLPELPRLPELPGVPEFEEDGSMHQLPTFPRNDLGEKFSQNTIKEAVKGGKEGEGEYADDFFGGEKETMQNPLVNKPFEESLLKSPRTQEIDDEMPEPEFFKEKPKPQTTPVTTSKNKGPIFVRLDKFEESLKIFEETKKEISGITKLLNDTKELKAKEEETLNNWERELQHIKGQIEKVDRDLFSKV